MKHLSRVSIAAALGLFACSSSSAPAGPADSGIADTGAPDTAPAGNPFAVDSGATVTNDAGSKCDTLLEAVVAAGRTAAACDPSAAPSSQCTATADGPCCKLTVSTQNTSAVADYEAAVATYRQTCSPDCTKIPCPIVSGPSGTCIGSGHQGTCQ